MYGLGTSMIQHGNYGAAGGTEHYWLSFNMKEQLQMKRIDEKSVVTGDEKELLSISSGNSFSGQVLYDSFRGSISPNEEAEINVLSEELS